MVPHRAQPEKGAWAHLPADPLPAGGAGQWPEGEVLVDGTYQDWQLGINSFCF